MDSTGNDDKDQVVRGYFLLNMDSLIYDSKGQVFIC